LCLYCYSLLDNIWVGGTDLENEGEWIWASTQTPIQGYTHWAPNEPNSYHNRFRGYLSAADGLCMLYIVYTYLYFKRACAVYKKKYFSLFCSIALRMCIRTHKTRLYYFVPRVTAYTYILFYHNIFYKSVGTLLKENQKLGVLLLI